MTTKHRTDEELAQERINEVEEKWDNEHEFPLSSEQHGYALVPAPVTDHLTISIPEDATIQERLTLMSFMGDTESLWNQTGEILTITGIAVVDSYKRDENGEPVLDDEQQPTPCKMTIWRADTGKLYRCQSFVAYGFCKDRVWPIMTATGKPGMLLAPISIKIGQKLTRNGKRTFKFDVVG